MNFKKILHCLSFRGLKPFNNKLYYLKRPLICKVSLLEEKEMCVCMYYVSILMGPRGPLKRHVQETET